MPKNNGARSVRFAKNVVWSMMGQVCVMALSFLLAPYLIHKLGVQVYGLYIILNAVAGYLLILCFGASPAIMKFLSEFAASGDSGKIRRAVGYSLALHAVGPALGSLAIGLGARFLIVRVFHVSGPLVAPGVFTLRCLAVAGLAISLTSWASSVLAGLQIFKWQSAIYVAQNGLMILGAALAVFEGYGIRGIARWYAALNIGLCFVAVSIAAFVLKPLWDRGAAPGQGHGIREFGGYGLSLWLGQIAWIVTYQFDKIFLARGTSIAGMTLYSVPAGLLQRLQFFPSAVAVVLLPVLSEAFVRDSASEIKRIYLKTSRGLLWMLLPIYIFLFAVMPQFLGLWVGGSFSSVSVWPARFLVLAQIMLMLNYIPGSAAMGGGKPLYTSVVVWGQAVISVVAWKLLIPHYGIAGAGFGSLLAQLIPDSIYLGFVHKRVLSLGWKEYFSNGLHAPFVCGGLLAGVLLGVHSWLDTWPKLIAAGILGVALFWACGVAIAEDEDRRTLGTLWGHALSLLKMV
ncbi:MAG TPA: oligosaccharide flippase family protein [Elusimicrobiota bacterium]|nr:oligosaccharide flippase family protein [Elusimicrobiota bacterium]